MTSGLCMVAHPDDCVIFGMSFMHHHPELTWTVGYLTYDQQHARGAEFQRFWHRRGVQTVFLGYHDDFRDIDRDSLSFDSAQASNDIAALCQQYDLVLTHDAEGEYGHPHHRFVHAVVTGCHRHVIRFAGPGQGTLKYTVPQGTYDLDELPLHREVIEGFHSTGHTNEYQIPQALENLR